MISRADRDLVARESELPGLETLLDPDRFLALLAGHHKLAGATDAEPTYIRLKPATSALVAYRVTISGSHHLLYGLARRGDELDKLAKVGHRARADTPSGVAGLLAKELALAVYVFPNDRELHTLPELAQPQRRSRLLARLLSEPWPGCGLRPLSWKPERRFVCALEGRFGKRMVAKLYSAAEFPGRSGAKPFHSSAGVIVPTLLAASKRKRMLLFEWVDGEPLDQLLEADRATPDGLERLGAALASLHQQTPGSLRRPPAGEPAHRLGEAVSALGVAGDQVLTRARSVASELRPWLPGPGPGSVPLHGDFSADQALIGRRRPTLVDFDEARWGDPLEDLCSFAADLELRAITGALAPGAATEAAAVVADAYLAHSPDVRLDPIAHAAGTAASLLRRAGEPFRQRRPEWKRQIEAAVERAAAIWSEARVAATASARPAATKPQNERLPELLDELHPGPRESLRLGIPDTPLRLRRAWPRDGGLLVEYEAGDGRLLAGGLERPGVPEPRARDGARPALIGASSGLVVALHAPGRDPRLPGLTRVAALPGAEVIGHRAGRRALVRIEGPGAPRFAKVVRPSRVERVVSSLRTGSAIASGFETPRLLDCDEGAGIVTCAALPGAPLEHVLGTARAGDAMRAAGGALRELHEAALPAGLAEHGAQEEIAVVRDWLGEVERFMPGRWRSLRAHALRVCAQLGRVPLERALPIHRDLHEGQLLISDDLEVAILDLDTLAGGDPVLDLANLLAHLELRSFAGCGSGAGVDELAAELLAGYGFDHSLADRAAVYADSARLRLACVHSFRPHRSHLALRIAGRIGEPLPGSGRLRASGRARPIAAASPIAL